MKKKPFILQTLLSLMAACLLVLAPPLLQGRLQPAISGKGISKGTLSNSFGEFTVKEVKIDDQPAISSQGYEPASLMLTKQTAYGIT